jgi:signal transduction histidine kinase
MTTDSHGAARALDPSSTLIHELSSPLTSLLFELDALAAAFHALGQRGGVEAASRIEAHIVGARVRAEHAHALVAEHRAALAGGVAAEPIDVRAAVTQAIALATPALRDRCQLRVRLGETAARVVATETRLVQIVLALLTNAAEALPPGNRIYNEVTIRVAAAGDRIRLEIQDTGRGIPPHQLAHVFDVGFTTKADAAGHGLGLPVARTRVESFGGHLELESTFGLGTRVVVALPRAGDSS